MRKLLTSPWTLLAVIALLRLPGFAYGVLNIDESDYLVYGAGILKGLLPYRTWSRSSLRSDISPMRLPAV